MQTRNIVIAAIILVIILGASIGVWFFYYRPTTVTLVVQTQPGWVPAIEAYIKPRMKEQYNIDLEIVEGISQETLSKVWASPDNPPYDVILIDDYPFLQGKAANLWATLSEDEISYLADVPDWAKDADGKGVYTQIYTMGLGYRSDILEDQGISAPTSWGDLWKPEFNDKATIQSISSTWSVFFMMQIAAWETDNPEAYRNETEMMMGLQKIEELKDSGNIHVFHGYSSEGLALLESGEVWMEHMGGYRILGGLQAKGFTDAKFALAENTLLGTVYMAITEGSAKKDAAYKFVDMSLSPGYQAEVFRRQYLGATNPNARAQLNSTEKTSYDSIYANLEDKIIIPDWEYVATHQDDWKTYWETNIET